MMKALEEPTASPHISFIQGLLPHLNKFDDSEILEFQMGVLETISKINKTRKNTAQPQLLPPQTQQLPLPAIPTTIPSHSINHTPHHKCLFPITSPQIIASNHNSHKPISFQIPKPTPSATLHQPLLQRPIHRRAPTLQDLCI